MMESILKTIKSVNGANHQFNKLSAFAWSSHSTWINSQKTQPADLTLKVVLFHSSKKAASKYS